MIGLSFIFSLFLVGGTISLTTSFQAIHNQGALVNGRAQRQVRISFEYRDLFLAPSQRCTSTVTAATELPLGAKPLNIAAKKGIRKALLKIR